VVVERAERRLVDYAGLERTRGIKQVRARQLVHRRAIPHIRIGVRSVMFDLAEVDRWLDAHTVLGTAAGGVR
jgi:predicted DNA-binding transcriptional regulator AlpA